MIVIQRATTAAEIAATFEVFQELRVHLKDVSEFVSRVQSQQEQGYVLLSLLDDDEVKGIAGYRIWDNLEAVEPRFKSVATFCDLLHALPHILCFCWRIIGRDALNRTLVVASALHWISISLPPQVGTDSQEDTFA